MDNRQLFLEKAEALKPCLHVETVRPVTGLPETALSEGDSVVLDFGNHFVGHFAVKLGSEGSHPDAPAWLRFKFCENERELNFEDMRLSVRINRIAEVLMILLVIAVLCFKAC